MKSFPGAIAAALLVTSCTPLGAGAREVQAPAVGPAPAEATGPPEVGVDPSVEPGRLLDEPRRRRCGADPWIP